MERWSWRVIFSSILLRGTLWFVQGFGERGDSASGFGPGCLLERRLGVLIGRLWVWALYVLDCCGGFGLDMWTCNFCWGGLVLWWRGVTLDFGECVVFPSLVLV